MTSLSLDVVIRGTGSIRSPSDHIAALGLEAGDSRVIMASAGAVDPEALAGELDQNPEAKLLVYGDEATLPLLKDRSADFVWLAVGAGVNPLRNVWRLRGGFPWLAAAKLGLLLEDQAAGESLGSSQLLKTGRIARVLTLPPVPAPDEGLALVAAAAAELAAEPDGEPLAELPLPEPEPPVTEGPHENVAEAPLAEEGVSEQMSVYPYVPAAAALMETERNTEQALINRYALVKERRMLLPKLAQLEEATTGLLKEIFVTRYTAGPEAAAVFQDLTGKLAQTAAEYRELAESLAKVEKQLEELAWLKGELEM